VTRGAKRTHAKKSNDTSDNSVRSTAVTEVSGFSSQGAPPSRSRYSVYRVGGTIDLSIGGEPEKDVTVGSKSQGVAVGKMLCVPPMHDANAKRQPTPQQNHGAQESQAENSKKRRSFAAHYSEMTTKTDDMSLDSS